MLIRVRAYVPEIFFGALLAVAVFGMGMLFGSSSHQPTQAPSNQHSATTSGQKNSQPSPHPKPFSAAWFLHDATGFFTVALVIVVGAQVVLLLWQLFLINRTMRDQARATDAASKSAEAAKISADATMGAALPRFVVTSIQFTGKTDLPRETRPIEVKLKNIGQSVAVVVADCLVRQFGPALPPELRYPFDTVNDKRFGDLPVERNEECRVERGGGQAQATSDTLMWVYGYIDYRDFLDQRWRKGFCAGVQIDPAGRPRFVQNAGPENYTYTKRD